MKKQIFILVLAFIALSFSTAYAQLPARPIDVTCLPNDALHPMPGFPYNYIIDVPSPGGTKKFTWFVTQEKNFIVAGVLTTTRELADGTGTHIQTSNGDYNNPASTSLTLPITWKSFTYDAANPVFVVVQAINDDGTCSTKNMRVYKIMPVNGFTLDIANMDKSAVPATPNLPGALLPGYGVDFAKCISDPVSATYDVTAPEGIKYDFGVDYMFFEVVAANFSTEWKPSFTLTGIDPLETIKVEYSTDKTFPAVGTEVLAGPANSTAITQVMNYTTTAKVAASVASGGTVGSTGESIYVRVTLTHTAGALSYQGLAAEVVKLAVDGQTQLALATPKGDVHFSKTVGVGTDCGKEDGFNNDIAQQTLKPRPTINADATMPAPGLLPVK